MKKILVYITLFSCILSNINTQCMKISQEVIEIKEVNPSITKTEKEKNKCLSTFYTLFCTLDQDYTPKFMGEFCKLLFQYPITGTIAIVVKIIGKDKDNEKNSEKNEQE